MADKEYIEREATLHSMKVDIKPPFAVVRDMPAADVVEVVRCKDCKYIRPIVDEVTHEADGYWCSAHDLDEVELDDFCSYGERKDGSE